MGVQQVMQQKLQDALLPVQMEIEDDSARHAGHAGVAASGKSGETHFNVMVVSDKFVGMTRIARHRLVYDILSEEMERSIHALSLKLYTSEELAK